MLAMDLCASIGLACALLLGCQPEPELQIERLAARVQQALEDPTTLPSALAPEAVTPTATAEAATPTVVAAAHPASATVAAATPAQPAASPASAQPEPTVAAAGALPVAAPLQNADVQVQKVADGGRQSGERADAKLDTAKARTERDGGKGARTGSADKVAKDPGKDVNKDQGKDVNKDQGKDVNKDQGKDSGKDGGKDPTVGDIVVPDGADATDLYYSGKRKLDHGDFGGAIADLRASHKVRSSVRTLTLLGRAYFDSDQFGMAEKVFKSAGTYDEAMLLLGQLYQQAGKADKARKIYDKFLVAHPEHPKAEWVRKLLQAL